MRAAALVLIVSMSAVASTGAQPRVSFKEVVVGLANACALAADGQAWCWGDNTFGQLGDGTKKHRPLPAPVSGGLTFTQLVMNGNDASRTIGIFACGLAADGAAHCWGNNDLGQLGDGTTTDRLVPTRVASPAPFARLSTGAATVCGITRDGRLLCWGAAGVDAVGMRRGSQSVPMTKQPIEIPLPASVKPGRFIADAVDDPCVIGEDGAAYCWVERDGRMIVSSLTPPDLAFRSVALSGLSRKCGLTAEGGLRCWMQQGGSLELSLGAMSGRNPPPPGSTMSLEHILPEMPFDQLVRDYDMCALSKEGHAMCVAGERLMENKPLIPRREAAPLAFTQLWMMMSRRCGLTASGELHCWSTDRAPSRVGEGVTFTSMARNRGGTSCAVATDGRVYCWGENGQGQLGDGTRQRRDNPAPVKLP